MFDLAIRNGMLVTADRVFGGHLYVRNGKIVAISDDGTLPAREELDAAGLYVLPGMLDCHAHINDPGFTWREDLPHASEAAAVGGVTTLIDMPLQNTPPLTSADAFANKLAVFEGRSLVDYALWGGLVTDNTAELAGMDAAGAVGFKAFIAPVSLGYSSVDMGLAREALFRIKAFGGLAGFHCEDHALICAGEAKAKAGGGTRRAFLDSRPVVAEVIATANVIELARETGARVHICHVSHPRVAELVRRAQADGLVRHWRNLPPLPRFYRKKPLVMRYGLQVCAAPADRRGPRRALGIRAGRHPCPVSARIIRRRVPTKRTRRYTASWARGAASAVSRASCRSCSIRP